MPVRLVGRVGKFEGTSLYKIAAKLKNCGEGRVVTRHAFLSRYPEKSYYILSKVVPDMTSTKDFGDGEAWGIKVFRGKQFEGIRKIDVGHKADWKLIPKDEEEEFCRLTEKDIAPPRPEVPKHINFPPTLEIFLKNEMKRKGNETPESMQLTLKILQGPWSRASQSES